MAKKQTKKEDKKLNLESILFNCRDYLRSNATKEDGEFYTPHDIVELIVAFIEPFDGTLYDPCCGSGGMFVQCAKYVEAKRGDIKTVNVYDQESDPATYRLAKMNLAVRGFSHHLGAKNASTFTHDMHKGLVFDYIMANPPFNLKKWYDTSLSSDARWADYALPPESNANYAWILHMLSKLKAGKGVAGFLLANGTLGDSDAVEIRKKLIESDKVEANGFSLVPSRYIEFVDRDSDIDYNKVLTETALTVSDLMKRQKANDETLHNALKQLGYEHE